MSISVKDSGGSTVNVKSTTDGTDEVPHNRIDGTVAVDATGEATPGQPFSFEDALAEMGIYRVEVDEDA